MKRFLFAALMLVTIHYSLSGIMLPDPPSHWLAPLTNDVRSVVLGGLPFDEHVVSIFFAAAAIVGLGLGIFALFGWVVPRSWFLPSSLVGSGCSIALYLLFFNRWALIPLALNAFILASVLGARWFVPQETGNAVAH